MKKAEQFFKSTCPDTYTLIKQHGGMFRINRIVHVMEAYARSQQGEAESNVTSECEARFQYQHVCKIDGVPFSEAGFKKWKEATQ